MGIRPITVGARTIVPVELLQNPDGALIDFTLENGAWTQGADPDKVPRHFREAHKVLRADGSVSAISFPRSADITEWLKDGVVGKVPIYAEMLAADLWPRAQIGDKTPELGPNDFLKYDQGPAWEALTNRSQDWPFGRVLVLKCGAGKTVLSLRAAQNLGMRTLVVCHTWNMCKQWAAEARGLFGVRDDQIGFIGDGNIDWRKDLVFSTMPGILCREYPDEFWYWFGTTIFDEGDMLGASQMRHTLDKFYGVRVLVTATYKRSDGNEALFAFHVGDKCFEDTEDDIIPDVSVINSPVPEFIPVKVRKKVKGKIVTRVERKPAQQTIYNRARRQHTNHIPKTVSLLSSYAPRKEWCLDVVKQLLDDGRKILFVGTRVEDLQWFHAQAEERFDGYASGIILGKNNGIDEEQAAHALEVSDVTWGIYQLAKRGMNERSIDTVILQYSQVNEEGAIRQLTGRACRWHPDKKKSLVVLLNDAKVPCLEANTHKIVNQLIARGSEVTWYEQ